MNFDIDRALSFVQEENKNWNELKDWLDKQILQSKKIDSPMSKVLTHAYTDVKNKMWSLEKK